VAGSPYLEPAVAAAYERIAAPAQFAAPARDLVAMIRLPPDGKVLDVGTGTGILAAAASHAVGPAGLVVGMDPSPAMLRASGRRASNPVVAARAPGLPFRDGVFDGVAASFVVSHLEDDAAALVDMRRVCRGGGRVGITTWDAGPNPVGELWRQVAAAFPGADRLPEAFRRIVPGEERFSHPQNVERALRSAGLEAIEVVHREYPIRLSVADYLSMKEASVEGTLLRRMLDSGSWTAFKHRVADAFRTEFGDTVAYVRGVHVGIGSKGGD
jgi:ubiquinone/menaquinone biosynthesis C-methylase UbiE